MADYNEVVKLDPELLESLSGSIEDAVNDVLTNEPHKDGRIEVLTIVMSLAAQLSVELGVEEDSFVSLATTFRDQAEQELVEDIDISLLN